jgi:hypothetical protein
MTSPPTSASGAILADAARVALRAPSVMNTQPWQWRFTADVLELHADRGRQLEVADPVGRLLTLSCGAALDHARTALVADGHEVVVERQPDPAQPDLLARLGVTGTREPDLADLALRAAIERRHTDRRGYGDQPVPPPVVRRLCAVAQERGAALHVVRDDQLPALAAAATRASEVELTDPEYRVELIRWTNRPQWSGDGVPAGTAVTAAAPRPVPVRELSLGPERGMAAGPGTDRGACYAILFGDGDEPADWLRAGEALSAVLLTATAAGISAAPMSDVIEVGGTRERLRGLLSRLGHPYLVLRFGFAVAPGTVPATPRRDIAEVVDEHRRGGI